MDPHALKNYARPCKQIVIFFLCPQAHEQKAKKEMPRYEFDQKEQQCFENMMHQARTLLNRGNHDGKGIGNVHDTDSSEKGSQNGASDSDEVVAGLTPSDQLPELELACLRSSLALLERRARAQEYEMPMTCAMAVLAVKLQGWRTAHEYPPIMSHIIKMARFMIIQAAFEFAPAIQESTTTDERDMLGYVTRFVDGCMIRGKQGAMQWIFDHGAYA